MAKFNSKLPQVGTTIFTTMSKLAKEHKAINLSQGFPDFDCDEALKEYVVRHLKEGKNQYAPMAGIPELRERLAVKIKALYNLNIDPNNEITITAGATQAIFTAIQAFISNNDEVIIIEPAYDCYQPAIELCGGRVVPYALEFPDYDIDWHALEAMVTSRTKMLIINTPHNPTGKTLTADDLKILQAIAERHDLIILSDEVYEHLIYDNITHQSILRYPALFKRSMAVFSFGKTFHTTGWKTGYIVGHEILMKEFRKVHQYNVFSVNTFVQFGIADYLSNPDRYLSLPDFFQRKRDLFQNEMIGSKFKPLTSTGSYFQLYDYSALSELNDIEFSKKLTTDHGVAVIPVSPFRTIPKQEKVVRFCFAKKESTLKDAAERLRTITSV